MSSRIEWARAYARQAASDWEVYLQLTDRRDAPRCHALHFLQMATEKIAKAYRFRHTNTPEASLLTRHVGFQAFMRQFLRSPRVLQAYEGRAAQLGAVTRDCHQLAGEVEKLAPAVGRTDRPQNAEYPWRVAERITAPIDYDFSNLSFVGKPLSLKFQTTISSKLPQRARYGAVTARFRDRRPVRCRHVAC
ncbi:MAG: hypothetical protein V3V08_17310 [Nannocystaceae bacterium]